MAMISNISPLLVIISLLLLTNNVDSQSFKLPTFGQYTNTVPLTLEGDASVTNGYLQLTKVVNGIPFPNSAGRASYSAPVHLWDAKSGKLAGFNTSFTFVVEPIYYPGLFGDGISFFISPFSSKIPGNSSGGYLGLFSADSALNAYQNRIVAVEFDTFGNQWDPVSPHVGIDINSIASAITVPWQGDSILPRSKAFATVSYEPVAKNLSVSLSYPSNIVNGPSISVSFVVDLRTVLPEWVRVGFSGATGELVEQHKILSWYFSSGF